jgi:TonB family protein
MRRDHEYAADQISCSLVGPDIAAEALINVSIKGERINQKTVPSILKKVTDLPLPPENLLEYFNRDQIRDLPDEERNQLLARACEFKISSDSHPGLRDRIHALYSGSAEKNVEVLLNEIVAQSHDTPSAARDIFGDSYQELAARVDAYWYAKLETPWKQQHAALVECKKKIKDLIEVSKNRELSCDEYADWAAHYYRLDERDLAIEKLSEAHSKFPESADINHGLGTLLIEKDDPRGVEHLKTAMERDSSRAIDCSTKLSEYYSRSGQLELSEEYRKKTIALYEEVQKAALASFQISKHDSFVAQDLPIDRIEKIRGILKADPRIKQAWLVVRKRAEILRDQPVLVVKLGSPDTIRLLPIEVNQAVSDLAKMPELEGFYLTTWEGILSNLGTACKSLARAHIYDIAMEEAPFSVSTHVAAKSVLLESGPIKPSRVPGIVATVIGLSVAVLFIGVLWTSISATHDATDTGWSAFKNDRNVSEQVNYDAFTTAMKHKIYEQWDPPKGTVQNQVLLAFQVHRDGTVSNLRVTRSSGLRMLDSAAILAVRKAAPFSPPPAKAPDPLNITFYLNN